MVPMVTGQTFVKVRLSMAKYSPISVDNMWDELSDDAKFKLWNFTSSKLFYGRILSGTELELMREELSSVVDEVLRYP
jgi:hypothetical protein